jgi:hypothetical protein
MPFAIDRQKHLIQMPFVGVHTRFVQKLALTYYTRN